jgi:hypothetical protein
MSNQAARLHDTIMSDDLLKQTYSELNSTDGVRKSHKNRLYFLDDGIANTTVISRKEPIQKVHKKTAQSKNCVCRASR